MLWERGGRFSQRHAGTGSFQLAAGEVTATLLGGCAHSKRSGRGARPLLPGPEHRETHPDSTEKAFNEPPWSSCSQAPPARSFNKYSAKRSGGLAGRQRAGAVAMHTTSEEPSGHTTLKRPRTPHRDTSIFLFTRREHTQDLGKHTNTRLRMRRPILHLCPGTWPLERPLLALRSGTEQSYRLYHSLVAWYSVIRRAEKALACVGVGPGGECVQLEDRDTPAVYG